MDAMVCVWKHGNYRGYTTIFQMLLNNMEMTALFLMLIVTAESIVRLNFGDYKQDAPYF